MKKKAALAATLIALCVPYTVPGMTLEEYIDRYNPGNGMFISREIKKAGKQYDIDPLLLASIYYTESRFSNSAVSAAGAIGIAQLMPGTAAEMQADPYDAAQNIAGGARYFRQMLDMNAARGDSQIDYALSAYNTGPGNVENGIPSYTYGYIRDVRSEYQKLRESIDWTPESGTIRPRVSKNTRRNLLIARLRNALAEKKKAIAAAKRETAPEHEKEKKSDIFFF